MSFDWICPHCERSATITPENFRNEKVWLPAKPTSDYLGLGLNINFTTCPNPKCRQFTLSVSLCQAELKHKGSSNELQLGKVLQWWNLVPDAQIKPVPTCVPEVLKQDYVEACRIQDLSPKASATLSRRCLQGMIRDFWQVKSGRLVDEIAAIQPKVDPLTWQAIEAVRKVGNIGAHMEADLNVIIDVEPNEAKLMIGLIESLFKDWYAARESKRSHLSALIQMADKKEQERKQKGTKPLSS